MKSVELIKQDFPILGRTFNGHGMVYLDNAATTQKPLAVIEAISDYYENYNSNVHRGVYRLSEESTDRYEKSRENIASFVSSETAGLVFVRNATEALNLLAYSLGHRLKRGDIILLSEMEHHSNIVPWQFLMEKGVKLDYVKMTSDYTLDRDDYANKLKKKPKIVSITQASNVLGTINPVKEMATEAHEAGSTFIVDGAQSVPHMPVDFHAIGCDFLVFSGHKMLGPMGIGCLAGNLESLESMDPFLGGGDMIREVQYERATWNDVPYKFEAGTPNVAGAIGLSAAANYLRDLGMEEVRGHEKTLMKKTLDLSRDVEDLVSFGPPDPEMRGGVFSFNIGNLPFFKLNDKLEENDVVISGTVHPHDLAASLDSFGIMIRSGHHCAMPLMGRLDVAATSRASYYVYNSLEDVKNLFAHLNEARKVFAR
ncbi:MAG: SufS family cysteine desulfurase [Candidatus Thermoplasmatota archaeon]|jgi:cysteine desulfurase/selenocysteine lyase|nr:SufS family cysteine desulfurase [Candidatus Thermoplasmatota archaeon]